MIEMKLLNTKIENLIFGIPVYLSCLEIVFLLTPWGKQLHCFGSPFKVKIGIGYVNVWVIFFMHGNLFCDVYSLLVLHFRVSCRNAPDVGFDGFWAGWCGGRNEYVDVKGKF